MEKKRYLSRQTSVLDIKSYSSTRTSPPLLLDITDDPEDSPTVQDEVRPP